MGREPELDAITSVLGATGPRPAGLVLLGEAGIGKSSLVQIAIDTAQSRFTTLVARPGAMQSTASFATVMDLTAGLDRLVDELPVPQSRALRIATLREAAGPSAVKPQAVAVAFHNLLAALGTNGPFALVIDDAQWVDEASQDALAFAARRLDRTPVRWVIAARPEPGRAPERLVETVPPERLVTRTVGPVSPAVVHRIVRDRIGVSLPRHLLTRIADTSQGNPFFALELARAVLRDGDLRPGRPLPLPSGPSELVGRRVRSLDPRTRESLLLLAAMDRPSLDRLRAAAGAEAEAALDAAEAAGLVVRGLGEIAFEHPLVAAAAYSEADAPSRRAAHRRLAAATTDVEEHARHLARSATVPEEAIASALDIAAAAAESRAARASAAELSELAWRLTPRDREDAVAGRRLRLATRLLRLGELRRAESVAEAVIDHGPAGPIRARARLVVGQIRWWSEGFAAGREQAIAAKTEPGIDAAVTGEIEYLLGQTASTREESLDHLEQAIDSTRRASNPGLLAELLLARAEIELGLGRGVDDAAIAEASELERAGPPRVLAASVSSFRAVVDVVADDLDRARQRFESLVAEAALRGEEPSIRRFRAYLAWLELRAGRWQEAERHARAHLELLDPESDLGDRAVAIGRLGAIDAHRGREAVARARLAESVRLSVAAHSGITEAVARANFGLLEIALRNWSVAEHELRSAETLAFERGLRDPGMYTFDGDLIEVLAERGQLEDAAERVTNLELRGRETGRPRAIAAATRAAALIRAARGDAAGSIADAERAMQLFAATPLLFEQARSLLVAGRVHRRARQKSRAHALLAEAGAAFDRLGAPLWAEQARVEQARVGLRPSAPATLTHTERRVAELAARGMTNREVAEAAFLTPRSVEGVLRRVYGKLGISSRAELGRRMSGTSGSEADDA